MNQQAKRLSTEQTYSSSNRLADWLERNAATIFILPAVLIVLFLSIFPLIISAFLSLARIRAVKGGNEIDFIGLKNFEKIIFGSGKGEFIGLLRGFSSFADTGWLDYFYCRYRLIAVCTRSLFQGKRPNDFRRSLPRRHLWHFRLPHLVYAGQLWRSPWFCFSHAGFRAFWSYAPVPYRFGIGVTHHPKIIRSPLFSRYLFAAHDDYPRWCRLHVQNDHRHQQRATQTHFQILGFTGF
jgi:ABC-type sugar transport system permease subunit